MSTSASPPGVGTFSAGDLIRLAAEHPLEPLFAGFWNVGDILLVHGPEDSFKSAFILEVSRSLAIGAPLLRVWPGGNPRRVGLLVTELHPNALGERLAKMFRGTTPPDNLCFLSPDALHSWRRRKTLESKFILLSTWIHEQKIEVLLIDIANDFFRGESNPNDETIVGEFFDHIRNLRLAGCGMVRHDRKAKGDEQPTASSNERIRGSAEWKEDPEVIVNLTRTDRRTNRVLFEVGKLRYGKKPDDDLELWFDAKSFRLESLPPVIAALEGGPLSREGLLAQCRERFGLGERKADELLAEVRKFLRERMEGHQKVFELDRDLALEVPWYRLLSRG